MHVYEKEQAIEGTNPSNGQFKYECNELVHLNVCNLLTQTPPVQNTQEPNQQLL